jgi:hypothetical protein
LSSATAERPLSCACGRRRAVRTSTTDAGFAGSGHHGRDRYEKPIEIIMACAAGRISIGDGRYWARTSDPQLVELVLSQLS